MRQKEPAPRGVRRPETEGPRVKEAAESCVGRSSIAIDSMMRAPGFVALLCVSLLGVGCGPEAAPMPVAPTPP